MSRNRYTLHPDQTIAIVGFAYNRDTKTTEIAIRADGQIDATIAVTAREGIRPPVGFRSRAGRALARRISNAVTAPYMFEPLPVPLLCAQAIATAARDFGDALVIDIDHDFQFRQALDAIGVSVAPPAPNSLAATFAACRATRTQHAAYHDRAPA